MSYIGNPPISGNFQVCDAISVVNGQAAYTMQVSSVNVTPESANHMLVSLNGILQKPNSSFTVSGSTITFANNNSSNASINGRIFIYDPSNTAIDTYARSILTYHIDGDKVLMDDGASRIEETAAVDGFRFVFSSGNITDGVFKLYGIT